MTPLDLPRADTDRTKYITSTDMRTLSGGNAEQIEELFKEKLGGPPKNLDHVFRVQLGRHTEPFHASWHAKTNNAMATQIVGLRLADPAMKLPDWAAASFDYWCVPNEVGKGYDDPTGEILELKHTNERTSHRQSADYYMGQLQWQLFCAGQDRLRYSAIFGNTDPVWGHVEKNPVLQEMLLETATKFRECIEKRSLGSFIVPDVSEEVSKTLVAGRRAYDWTKDNRWNSLAVDFIAARSIAPVCKKVEDAMKKLVPADAGEVTGQLVSVKRDARGALRWTIDDKANEQVITAELEARKIFSTFYVEEDKTDGRSKA